MEEFSADLYSEYIHAGYDLATNYVTTPGVINSGIIRSGIETVLGSKHKLASLVNASLILRIHVEVVADDADRDAHIPIHPLPLKCVTARIVDTIKGNYIRQCEAVATVKAPCISFHFSPVWQKENYYASDVIGVGIDEKGIAHYPCDNCYRDTSIYAGKDYVVFLQNVLYSYDGTYAYYSFIPLGKYSAEGGIFPILPNGNVWIPSDYFGYGREVPYERFLELIRKDIALITSP